MKNLRNSLKSEKKVNTRHLPVLLKEVIENLNIGNGDIVLDGTLGGGGYTERFCEVMGSEGVVVGIDQDMDAITRTIQRLGEKSGRQCKRHFAKENFRNLDKVLENLNISKVKAVVFDLGLSSDQFEQSGRGFSFQKDEPLLMTFGKSDSTSGFTAKDIVNTWDEENIADIIFGYGGEKFSRRIAKNIVEARPIETTFQLVEVIRKSVPVWYRSGRKTHCATKTFQALRVAVNDELGSLKEGLEKGFDALEKGGRMAVVSFHSTEDKIVKNFMRDKKNAGEGILITKKPIVPSRGEIKENPRARSSKLRVVEKVF